MEAGEFSVRTHGLRAPQARDAPIVHGPHGARNHLVPLEQVRIVDKQRGALKVLHALDLVDIVAPVVGVVPARRHRPGRLGELDILGEAAGR